MNQQTTKRSKGSYYKSSAYKGCATVATDQTIFSRPILKKNICTKPILMPVEILTKDDLVKFKVELMEDLRKVLSGQPQETKKWMKSYEVRRMLKISPGTLQNMRVNGTLPYTKIGGVIYYAHDDITRMLEKNKSTTSVLRLV